MPKLTFAAPSKGGNLYCIELQDHFDHKAVRALRLRHEVNSLMFTRQEGLLILAEINRHRGMLFRKRQLALSKQRRPHRKFVPMGSLVNC